MHLSIRGCALVVAATLAACSGGGGGAGGGGGGGTPTTPATPGTPATGVVPVHIAGLSFSPGEVTIATGASIQWVNDAAVAHTITPDNAAQAGAWPSQNVSDAGATYERSFPTPGDYAYHCNLHTGMRGTIHVRTP